MNLKEYALRYPTPDLNWLDGQLLKLEHGISDDALLILCRAIFCNHQLARRFLLRADSYCPESWDSLIEETSSELAECLAKLGGVQ